MKIFTQKTLLTQFYKVRHRLGLNPTSLHILEGGIYLPPKRAQLMLIFWKISNKHLLELKLIFSGFYNAS